MSVDPTQSSPEIENLLAETRSFPPDPAFTAQANATARPLHRGRRGLRGVLGAAGARAHRLVRAVPHDARVGPAVRQVVHRREAQHQLQLPRPPRRERSRRQGRLPLDRRAGRHPDADLRRPAARGLEDGQRAQGARHRDRRPGRHLHADDPGAPHRDARLRPARGAAHGHLRRVQRRGAVRPHQRRRGEAGDHRRRRLASRQARGAQAGRGRGARPDPDDRSTPSSCGGWATTCPTAPR